MTTRGSFIGRRDELEEAVSAIHTEAERVLSITGPGGIGKTRLAEEVVRALRDEFEDGAVWADLGTVDEPARVQGVLARELGLADVEPTTALDRTVAFLSERHALVVLDDCEHLIPSIIEVVEAIVDNCPDVRMVVTSREALRVSYERTIRLEPLSLPEPDDAGRNWPATVKDSDALQLFLDRAASVGGVPVDTDNAHIVAQICRLVDGIPLGIELAAAHTRAMGPDQVLAQIQQSLDVLGGGLRDLRTRHRTLRSTIEWSLGLLESGERDVMTSLTAFVGPMSWEAVEAVVNAAPAATAGTSLVEIVEGLVDKSLVHTVDVVPGRRHLAVLETIRRVVRDATDPERIRSDDLAHAAHYLELARIAESELRTSQQRMWVDRITAEYTNFRVAAERSARGEVSSCARAVEITNGLFWYWNATDAYGEGKAVTQLALDAVDADEQNDAEVVRGQQYLALLHWLLGDLEAARTVIERAMAQVPASDHATLGFGHTVIGRIRLYSGDRSGARSAFARATDLLRSSDGAPHALGLALTGLGVCASGDGDHELGRSACREALDLYERLGDPYFTALALGDLGWVLHLEGRDSEAAEHLRGSLRLRRQLDAGWLVAQTLHQLAVVIAGLGDRDAAVDLLEESLAVALDVGTEIWVERSRDKLAELAEDLPITATARHGDAQAPLEILSLGPFEVIRDGRRLSPADWSYAKPREILAFLLESPPRTKEEIGLVFWPDVSPTQLRQNLRSALYHLRQALGRREWIVYADGRYRFDRGLDHSYDVEAFERALEVADRAEADVAASYLERAIALYRGDLAADLSVDHWAADRREELRLKARHALARLGAILLENGRHEEAVTTWRRLLELDEYDERGHIGLARTLGAMGERATAIRHVEKAIESLRSDLGMEPSTELTALDETLRSGGNRIP